MTKEPTFTINPLDRVGPVRLGMTRLEVRDALAAYDAAELDQSGTLDYAFGNSLQIEYDSDGFVQFIGVGWYDECGCDYLLGDTHVGDLPSEEMFAAFAKLDGTEGLIYNPGTFMFPRIFATVWEADTQYDYRGDETRPFYGQIGIGSSAYARTKDVG